MGRWTRRRAKKTTRPAMQLPIGAAVANALVADLVERAGDFGPPAQPIALDEIVSDTWTCQHCLKVNFADGRKQCSHCLLAAPPDPFEDPSYCCEACEDLTARISQARRVVDGAETLLADLARELVELEARHRVSAFALGRLDESEVAR